MTGLSECGDPAGLASKCLGDEVAASVRPHVEVSERPRERPTVGWSLVLAEVKKSREWGLPGL